MLINLLRTLGIPIILLTGFSASMVTVILVIISEALDLSGLALTALPVGVFITVAGWWSGLGAIVGEHEVCAPRSAVWLSVCALCGASIIPTATLLLVAGQLGVNDAPVAVIAAAAISTMCAVLAGIQLAWVGALFASISESLGLLDRLVTSQPGTIVCLVGASMVYAPIATWLRRKEARPGKRSVTIRNQ